MEKPELFKGRQDSDHKWVRDNSGNEFLCPMSAFRKDGGVDFSECVSDITSGINPRGG